MITIIGHGLRLRSLKQSKKKQLLARGSISLGELWGGNSWWSVSSPTQAKITKEVADRPPQSCQLCTPHTTDQNQDERSEPTYPAKLCVVHCLKSESITLDFCSLWGGMTWWCSRMFPEEREASTHIPMKRPLSSNNPPLWLPLQFFCSLSPRKKLHQMKRMDADT
jgi:hypothetical protein